MIGTFAKSKAGHDKNKIYIIIEETNCDVYLVDGIIRTIENPKKKRKKHIQSIREYVSEELKQKIKDKKQIQNEEIKRQIKLYINGGNACQRQM